MYMYGECTMTDRHITNSDQRQHTSLSPAPPPKTPHGADMCLAAEGGGCIRDKPAP